MISSIRHRQNRRGQAMLETTLVLLIMITLLIGILDLGRILFINEFLTERVRTAARYASVNPYDATKIRNLVLYGVTSPGANAKPYMNLTASNVVVTRAGAGTSEDRVTVKITGYPLEFFAMMFVRKAPNGTSTITARDIVITQAYECVN